MAGRKPTVSDSEILSIFRESSDPALSTGEIADDLGMSQQGAYSRLSDLVDEGLIETKKFGQGRGWWLTEDGVERLESFD
jgi:predicted transcriptional regulator